MRRIGPRTQGYNSKWERARATWLKAHPHCRMCADQGQRIAATHVDHITPHKGDRRLFWDSANNWQGLCASHHSRDKQQQERNGYRDAVGADGLPLDRAHPFYK